MAFNLKPEEIGELAFDLQTGLGRLDIPEYDDLRIAGMASVLAIHIKGLQEISFNVLRRVCDHYFNIPSYVIKRVVDLLAEIEMVQNISEGHTIKQIIPTIPFFADVYSGIGEYASSSQINEHEQLVLSLLSKLKGKPYNFDALNHALGAEQRSMERTLQIAETGKVVRKHRARGQDIIVSPLYFSDGLEGLVDLAAGKRLSELSDLLHKIRAGQGWPLGLIETNQKIGTADVSPSEVALLTKLAEENIIKPPSLRIGSQEVHFVFTPKPGEGKLNASNRAIYEKAMALVSAVRKGQLLPAKFRIRSPAALLAALRDRGHIRASTEAGLQYGNLVRLRVGRLERLQGDWFRFSLVDTPENKQAVSVALGLISTGQFSEVEIDQDARLALSKDETYVDSVIASASLRMRPAEPRDPEAQRIFDNLLLGAS